MFSSRFKANGVGFHLYPGFLVLNCQSVVPEVFQILNVELNSPLLFLSHAKREAVLKPKHEP